ncbi:hypothetical protein GCM10009634_79610 [Saccharothrix xinjiangensis]
MITLHHDRAPFEPRPDGLLDLRRLEGVEDGHAVTLAQWAAPVDLPGAVAYRRYRSGGLGSDREVGCVVLVEVRFDRPGVAERWVDLVFEALAGNSAPGGVSARFHVSLDGTRVLNYAEWETARAHRDALAAGDGSVGTGEAWRRVRSFPGFGASDVRRYRVVTDEAGSQRG